MSGENSSVLTFITEILEEEIRAENGTEQCLKTFLTLRKKQIIRSRKHREPYTRCTKGGRHSDT